MLPTGIHKCRKPKMRDYAGRTWDQCEVLLPDGSKAVGHLDTTWGTRFYFEHDGAWRCGNIDKFDAHEMYAFVADLRH